MRLVGERSPRKFEEERTYIFYDKGVVEIEWRFVMEYAAYKDICMQYENNIKVDNVHHLFDKEKINQIVSFLVKTHRRRYDIERNMKMI